MAAYIGVTVAIAGNICISVALNIQKHVHNKLAERAIALDTASDSNTTIEENTGGDDATRHLSCPSGHVEEICNYRLITEQNKHSLDADGKNDLCSGNHDSTNSLMGRNRAKAETAQACSNRGLSIPFNTNNYGACDSEETSSQEEDNDWLARKPFMQGPSTLNPYNFTPATQGLSLSLPSSCVLQSITIPPIPTASSSSPLLWPHIRQVFDRSINNGDSSMTCEGQRVFNYENNVDYVNGSDLLVSNPSHSYRLQNSQSSHAPGTSYLSERLWWVGMAVMLLGELGNFAAYGFAPAVLVAPLGTVALISNALIAPAFLGETLRNQDIVGILFAVLGTGIILAVSSQISEPTLSADDIVAALTQPQFVLYCIVTASILSVMLAISYTPYGRKYIFVDLSIVALFGGYTVLATKALSSLLKMSFFLLSSHWVVYLMIFVLTSTAVLQVQHLNRALSAFDSVEVIPTNFVLFTTSSIIGSSILYNDLQRTNPLALLGVICMFFGVILITGKRDAIRSRSAEVLNGYAIEQETPIDEYNGEERDFTQGRVYQLDRTYRPHSTANCTFDCIPEYHEALFASDEFQSTTRSISVADSLPIPKFGVNTTSRPLSHMHCSQSLQPQHLAHFHHCQTNTSNCLDTDTYHLHTHVPGQSLHSPLTHTTTHSPLDASYSTPCLRSMRQFQRQRQTSASPSNSSVLSMTSDASQTCKEACRFYRLDGNFTLPNRGNLHRVPCRRKISESLPTRMADATFKNIATVFQSFGTHQIRRMELDCMVDAHASSAATGSSGCVSPRRAISSTLHLPYHPSDSISPLPTGMSEHQEFIH
ncbi:hypothetical protein O5D80_002954 [Batrachochytrium dendrobatidis]|nr:hypothetical protein O5D80_002954 [Batrachochytrium dendrobatidis]